MNGTTVGDLNGWVAIISGHFPTKLALAKMHWFCRIALEINAVAINK